MSLHHIIFVQNFLDRKDSLSRSSERIIYAVHKNKFIIPGFFTVKIIGDNDNGFKLMAFIKPLSHDTETFVFITEEK